MTVKWTAFPPSAVGARQGEATMAQRTKGSFPICLFFMHLSSCPYAHSVACSDACFNTRGERVYIRTTKTSRIVHHSCFSFARQPDLTGCCVPFCSLQGVLGKVARCMRKAACNGACNVVHNMIHSGNKTLLCIHYPSSPGAPLWSLTVNSGKWQKLS